MSWAYRAPAWLRGGHAQTIWPALASRPRRLPDGALRRERWATPDDDFIDVDRFDPPVPEAPTLVLFHGLEGSRRSHYVRAFAHACQARGLGFALPHFRGCSGSPNVAPRAYHSGDHAEIDWILARLHGRPGPLWAAGVSLGGNALLKWAQVQGDRARSRVACVAAISAPLDLDACANAIARGFARLSYTPMFLRSVKPKARIKLSQFPALFDGDQVLRARTLRAFDDAFTAPLHGFAGVDDYYRRASTRWNLHDVAVPALVLNARNDPFVPAASLPGPHDASPWVTLWQPHEGGHVGFPAGAPPGHVMAMPEAVLDWMRTAAPPRAYAAPHG